MNLLDLMRNRRSVRKFSEQSIDDKQITAILEAGRLAPSGLNRQPWLFVVVKDKELKRKIRNHCEKEEKIFHQNCSADFKKGLKELNLTPAKPFLEQAPVFLVVFGKKSEPYWRQSVWIAVGYMILKIEDEGLASLTYTPPKVGFLNELLDIPVNYKAEVIIPIGYSNERVDTKSIKRKELSELVKFRYS